jgi:transposase/DNA-binding CsgD family transcriptional regulator
MADRKRRRSDRAGRPPMRSPGRPMVARREDRQRFWAAIRRGLSSEDAAVEAGVSPAVGTRWFRDSGGMPSISLAPVSGRYLSFSEREEIALLRARAHGVREIARQLRRSPSTISRELRRNAATRGGDLQYRATAAQWHADRRARRPKAAKLARHEPLRRYVQDRLTGAVTASDGRRVAGPDVRWVGRRHGRRQPRRWATAWSPEQIAKRLPIDFPDDDSMRVSHEAIYQALYVPGRGALRREWTACLRTGRALRSPRRSTAGRARRSGGGLRPKPWAITYPGPVAELFRSGPGRWYAGDRSQVSRHGGAGVVLGRKRFEPKLFYQVSLEERVPDDHLLRRVAAIVDFGFVRRLTARFYSHTGQPGIDPVVLFRLGLLGWLYGITSERRLAEECRLNLAFMWFLGYDLDEQPPDHSVLSKARARFGVTVYQAFFAEIVRQCERAGLIRGDRLYLDSTLVEANASLGSLGSRALVAQLAAVDEHLAAVWGGNPTAAPEADVEPGGPTEPGPVSAPATEPPQPHVAGPSDPPNGRPGRANELVVSRTDPDAGLVSRDGVPLDLYHKVHVGVDGGAARVITAVDVTPGEVADEDLLDRLIKEHAGATGRTVTEVIADAKYGTYANYRALEDDGIRASIPPHLGRGKTRAVPSELFVYDPAGDRFLCPEGQPLRRQGTSCSARPGGGIIYRASPNVCAACPLRPDCCGTATARTITRPDDSGLYDRTRAYLRTAHAKRSIRLRKCWAETVMAELKERHGVRRAQYRGRAKVRIQAFGAAIAYNVKKLVRWHGRRPQEPALALRPSGLPSGSPLSVHLEPVHHVCRHCQPFSPN